MPRDDTKPTSKLSFVELAEQRGYRAEPCKIRKGSYFLWKGEIAAQNPEREWLPYFTEPEARRFLAKLPVVR